MSAHKIVGWSVKDIRFPTSLEQHGSDAMHKDPDYSAAYVILNTDGVEHGHGMAFTLGKGTELVCAAIRKLARYVVGHQLSEIFDDFSTFWKSLTNDTQMRWLGPEKGVMHLATAAIVNALWDLWAKIEGKPLWKLLSDMEPEKLVSTIDFTYISDALTKEEALEILRSIQDGKAAREQEMLRDGFPAYTTSMGWLGYSDEKIKQLCQEALAAGFTQFKMKIGSDLEDDRRRAKDIREQIGYDNILMMDANQRWEVQEAIDWMKNLVEFKPHWIEEPTSCDDVLGHAAIAKALKPHGIGVATGEACHNRIMFKQLLQADAISFCQIDSCRLGGVNEILAVCLMAKKFGVPICPHAGGVGLCEMVQHLAIFNYIAVSGSLENCVTEFVDHLHEHFKFPCIVKNGHYQTPKDPGYSTEMKDYNEYEYPRGSAWQALFAAGKMKPPHPDEA